MQETITRAQVHSLIQQYMAQTLETVPEGNKRQVQEIEFDRIYAGCFAHGTDGHNLRIIAAKQAAEIEEWGN